MNLTEQIRKVRRNLGTGEAGGGVQERPAYSKCAKAEATALADAEGGVMGVATCCPRR